MMAFFNKKPEGLKIELNLSDITKVVGIIGCELKLIG